MDIRWFTVDVEAFEKVHCGECMFWRPNWQHSHDGGCHKNPPVMYVHEGETFSDWPPTTKDGFCFRGKKKREES